jgi:hypothetical protein
MRQRVTFKATRDLGAIRAPFGRPWLPSVRRCTGLSSAHWIMNSARAQNPGDWLLSCSGGHQTVRCGAPDYPVLLLTVGPGPTCPLAIGCWLTVLSGATRGGSNEL